MQPTLEKTKDNKGLKNDLLSAYQAVRRHSREICAPLKTEDYVVQPIVDVSPPKWHLAHTTWFFEMFILNDFASGYKAFDPEYGYLFNSYYEHFGERVLRVNRGNMTRPTVEEIYAYRAHVDDAMEKLLQQDDLPESCRDFTILGLNHEQQHQELLLSDIKYILGNNPLFPPYDEGSRAESVNKWAPEYRKVPEGVYKIGFSGDGFCYDNELRRHKVFLQEYALSDQLVTNQAFLEFMADGGYEDFRYWHADGWAWVKEQQINAPMYWHKINGQWFVYTLNGLTPLQPETPVCHVSYYEAAAYASWCGKRLPTEFEWEAAQHLFEWGQRWEWTESAYLPYPGFKKAPGAAGEYNGKFMVNQKVLRGASVATPLGHSRPTYRNFFQPHLRWQFTGIRLAQ